MGIIGFTKFFSDCLKERNLSEFKGSVVVVDAIYQIYKYCIAIRNSGEDMVNSNGKMKSHLFAIFNFSTYLLRNGLVPLFVFDGKPPALKRETLSMRKKRKNQALEDFIHGISTDSDTSFNSDDSFEDDDQIKNFKKSFKISDTHYLECQALLTAMGIPWIQAPEEADSQCAALSNATNVCGVISEDSDILVFGGNKLFKHLSPKKKNLQEITLSSVLNELANKANQIYKLHGVSKHVTEFKYNDFVNFSIIMGCDYMNSLKVDFHILFEQYVLKDFDVDNTISYLKKNHILGDDFDSSKYLTRFKEIREYYTDAKVINPNIIDKKLKTPNRHSIIRMMCYENEFDKKVIESMIGEIESVYYAMNAIEDNNNNGWFKSFKSYQIKYHKSNYKANNNMNYNKNTDDWFKTRELHKDSDDKYRCGDYQHNSKEYSIRFAHRLYVK